MKRNKQCRIGIFTRSAGITHAVCTDPPLFTGGSKNITSRTHAEGVGAGAIFKTGVQRIVGGRQDLGISAVLRRANLFLEVLNPHAHGKSFRLHGDALSIKRFKCISCRVPHSQNSRAAGDKSLS